MGQYYWIGPKLCTCDHNWRPNKLKVISRSSGHLLLEEPQTMYMWSQLGAEEVQGHPKVIGALSTGLASNLVHVIAIECQTSSKSSQGHWGILLLDWPQTWYMWWQLGAEQVQGNLKVIGAFITGLASNLGHVMAIGGRTRSRSSQGHRGMYYWIDLKVGTCDGNWGPNRFKVVSRSSGHSLLDCLDLRHLRRRYYVMMLENKVIFWNPY